MRKLGHAPPGLLEESLQAVLDKRLSWLTKGPRYYRVVDDAKCSGEIGNEAAVRYGNASAKPKAAKTKKPKMSIAELRRKIAARPPREKDP